MKENIAVIGVGAMGKAIASKLLSKQVVSSKQLFLSDDSQTNKESVERADIIILAVKPQVMSEVLRQIQHAVSAHTLVVSVAAGIEIKTIFSLLKKEKLAIVRVMPNLAAICTESMSIWVKNKYVSEKQAASVRNILSAIGLEIEVLDEAMLDIVTAISGSGPAYVFYITELLEKAARDLGIEKDLARKLARQTIIGSSALLKHSEKSAETLRGDVTSKGGTTEAAFKVFMSSDFEEVFMKAVSAAYKRTKELKEVIY